MLKKFVEKKKYIEKFKKFVEKICIHAAGVHAAGVHAAGVHTAGVHNPRNPKKPLGTITK